MYNVTESYRNVRLLPTDDPDYVGFLRRMADQHPGRGGPRAAGEYLGGLAERAVRHWLTGFVALSDNRILSWEQRLRNGRHGVLYREIDAVRILDEESLCLYEMKLTTPEQMERGSGIKQLNASAETLYTVKKYRYVLKRLVYVAEEQVPVLNDLPVLAPDDETEDLGVIWAPPREVEAAAVELEIALPADWLSPESREGTVDDPAREEWRQFAAVQPEPDDDDNPLARAMRKAKGLE